MICYNCYYEKVGDGEIKIDFKEPFSTNGCIWMQGYQIFKPMQTIGKINSETIDYIDIDAIDNKTNKIKYAKTILSKNAPSRAKRKVENGSTLFSMVRPYLRNIAYIEKQYEHCVASTGFYVCTPQFFIEPKYLYYLMLSSYVVNGINFYMKGDNSPSVRSEQIDSFLFPIPSLTYQQKVVQLLDGVFKKTDSLKNDLFQLNSYIAQLKSKLLDDIFGENSRYKSYYENSYLLGDILEYEQPAKYIVESTEYSDDYSIPVLTPGKTFILGFTNEKDGIYRVDGGSVIIFDDFTTASRIVDFDFKVKSSAIKILTVSNTKMFNIEYLYYLLQTIKVNNTTHKRYWISEFATKELFVHTIEQQKEIVNSIKSAFALLEKMSDSI